MVQHKLRFWWLCFWLPKAVSHGLETKTKQRRMQQLVRSVASGPELRKGSLAIRRTPRLGWRGKPGCSEKRKRVPHKVQANGLERWPWVKLSQYEEIQNVQSSIYLGKRALLDFCVHHPTSPKTHRSKIPRLSQMGDSNISRRVLQMWQCNETTRFEPPWSRCQVQRRLEPDLINQRCQHSAASHIYIYIYTYTLSASVWVAK